MDNAILIVCMIVILFNIYILIRNSVVYRYRMWVLRYSHPDIAQRNTNHGKLPSYDRMLLQIFRFDWSDYLK